MRLIFSFNQGVANKFLFPDNKFDGICMALSAQWLSLIYKDRCTLKEKARERISTLCDSMSKSIPHTIQMQYDEKWDFFCGRQKPIGGVNLLVSSTRGLLKTYRLQWTKLPIYVEGGDLSKGKDYLYSQGVTAAIYGISYIDERTKISAGHAVSLYKWGPKIIAFDSNSGEYLIDASEFIEWFHNIVLGGRQNPKTVTSFFVGPVSPVSPGIR